MYHTFASYLLARRFLDSTQGAKLASYNWRDSSYCVFVPKKPT